MITLSIFEVKEVKEFDGCQDPVILTVAFLLKSLINNKTSALKAKLSCPIHGLTRSRELVDVFKKLVIGISYQDVKNLYASWTMLN